MNEYLPDRWVLIDFSEDMGKSCICVLAGWGGSYLYGASWKRSTPISKVERKEDGYVLTMESGSRYIVSDGSVGFTVMTAGIATTLTENSLNSKIIDSTEEICALLSKEFK